MAFSGFTSPLRCVRKKESRSRSRTNLNPNAADTFDLNPFKFFKFFTSEQKCEWLRSQLIGSGVECQTPFGKRQLVYADSTASGRCLLYVENFLVKHVMPYYGNTHTEDSFVGHKTTHMMHEATDYVKELLGGTDRDAILFCGSGTTAAVRKLLDILSLAVPSSLRDKALELLVPETERWVVFIGPFEHHSNILPWRESLAEVVEIPVKENGRLDMEYLRMELLNPKYAARRKLGSFSACSNVTGVFTDTRAIARLLHRHGAFACFDFAASAPYVRIDMRSAEPDGYDAVMLSPHKFAGGPGTPGILLMNKSLYLRHGRPPSDTGGGVVDFVNYTKEDTLYLEDVEAREDAGTPSILQRIKAGLVFMVQEQMGYKLIESREQFFITTALKRLSTNANVEILGSTTAKRAAILSFLIHVGHNTVKKCIQDVKVLHGRFVATLLNDLFGVQSRGGCSCAGPYGHVLLGVSNDMSLKYRAAIQKGNIGVKPGWTRLSFSYFISHQEFEFLLRTIEFVAEYGPRFICMYDFNWQTGSWKSKKGVADRFLAETVPRVKTIDNSISGQHKAYLDAALEIAKALPKDVIVTHAPEYIDPELVWFVH